MQRLLIIGFGMAAARLIQEMRQLDLPFAVTVISEEGAVAYNRILLSSVLAGSAREEELGLLDESDAGGPLRIVAGQKVVSVDHSARRVTTDKGATYPYDRLVFATGSSPFLPPVPGINLPGILGFRTQSDLKRIREVAGAGRDAVIIGGGLLGLEAAHGLRRLDTAVTVINREDWLMPRQLDKAGAGVLQRTLESQYIRFLLGTTPLAIGLDGNSRYHITLSSGSSIGADLLLVAAGITPNLEPAQSSGVQCQRGIVVNEFMETSIPGVYAIGECCEFDGRTVGLVAPAYEQAAVLAAVLSGDRHQSFAHRDVPTRLKVSGVEVVSAGPIPFADTCHSQVVEDVRSGIYRKLAFEGSRLVGYLLVGDSRYSAWYERLRAAGVDISAIRHEMMFGQVVAGLAAAA